MPAESARPDVIPSVIYTDARPALDWLERAFGFERSMVISDPDGTIVHSQMRVGNGLIMVGTQWSERMRSPASTDAKNTQTIHVTVPDIDAHCERARAAGATIEMEPEDQFYGARTYRALDFEGHLWTFAQTVREVTREEAERDSGLTIAGWS